MLVKLIWLGVLFVFPIVPLSITTSSPCIAVDRLTKACRIESGSVAVDGSRTQLSDHDKGSRSFVPYRENDPDIVDVETSVEEEDKCTFFEVYGPVAAMPSDMGPIFPCTLPPVESAEESENVTRRLLTVTKTDVATFIPDTGTVTTEPDGWAIVGIDSVISSDSTGNSVQGQLFDESITVTFRPVSYSWDLDGVEQSTETPSITHVFDERGTKTIRVTPHYSATITTHDGLTQKIPGALPGQTEHSTVQVFEAHTVLVN